MRRTIIIMTVVLTASLALCTAGTWAVHRAVTEAEDLRQRAGHEMQLGNVDGALADMRALRAHWERRGRLLELVTSHDALYDVRSGIDDAFMCLEQGERAEFFRAIAAAGVALERIRITEAFRWANLY